MSFTKIDRTATFEGWRRGTNAIGRELGDVDLLDNDFTRRTIRLKGGGAGAFPVGSVVVGDVSGATATVLESDVINNVVLVNSIQGSFIDANVTKSVIYTTATPASFSPGELVTGGTSGATATIFSVSASHDFIVVYDVNGTFVANEPITSPGGAGNVASYVYDSYTANEVGENLTINPGTSWQILTANVDAISAINEILNGDVLEFSASGVAFATDGDDTKIIIGNRKLELIVSDASMLSPGDFVAQEVSTGNYASGEVDTVASLTGGDLVTLININEVSGETFQVTDTSGTPGNLLSNTTGGKIELSTAGVSISSVQYVTDDPYIGYTAAGGFTFNGPSDGNVSLTAHTLKANRFEQKSGSTYYIAPNAGATNPAAVLNGEIRITGQVVRFKNGDPASGYFHYTTGTSTLDFRADSGTPKLSSNRLEASGAMLAPAYYGGSFGSPWFVKPNATTTAAVLAGDVNASGDLILTGIGENRKITFTHNIDGNAVIEWTAPYLTIDRGVEITGKIDATSVVVDDFTIDELSDTLNFTGPTDCKFDFQGDVIAERFEDSTATYYIDLNEPATGETLTGLKLGGYINIARTPLISFSESMHPALNVLSFDDSVNRYRFSYQGSTATVEANIMGVADASNNVVTNFSPTAGNIYPIPLTTEYSGGTDYHEILSELTTGIAYIPGNKVFIAAKDEISFTTYNATHNPDVSLNAQGDIDILPASPTGTDVAVKISTGGSGDIIFTKRNPTDADYDSDGYATLYCGAIVSDGGYQGDIYVASQTTAGTTHYLTFSGAYNDSADLNVSNQLKFVPNTGILSSKKVSSFDSTSGSITVDSPNDRIEFARVPLVTGYISYNSNFNFNRPISVTGAVTISDTLRLTPLAAAPSTPSGGWIAMADGSTWNPGGTGYGAAPYPVYYDGTGWVPMI